MAKKIKNAVTKIDPATVTVPAPKDGKQPLPGKDAAPAPSAPREREDAEIAGEIRTAHERYKETGAAFSTARNDWIEATIVLATVLYKARVEVATNDTLFGQWLKKQKLDEVIGANERAALIDFGRDAELTRKHMRNSESRSIQLLHRDLVPQLVAHGLRKASTPRVVGQLPAPDKVHVDKNGHAKPAPMAPAKKGATKPAKGKKGKVIAPPPPPPAPVKTPVTIDAIAGAAPAPVHFEVDTRKGALPIDNWKLCLKQLRVMFDALTDEDKKLAEHLLGELHFELVKA